MPDRVRKIRFGTDPRQTEDYRKEVSLFDCGDAEWAREISEWLKGNNPKDSVWEDLKLPGAGVWLYYNTAGQLVGVGALGHNEWTVRKTLKKVRITVLTNLAVAKDCHHLPRGPGEKTYARQILDDLRSEAEKDRDERGMLCLWVHPRNPAKEWYERAGFYVVEPPTTRTGYLRMGLDLNKAPKASAEANIDK